MKKLFRNALCAVCFFLSGNVFAQQKPMFTHYVFNDYYYNPAVASTVDGMDFRVLYRNQWTGLEGKPQTVTFSSLGSLKKFPLGIGGNLYHDKTGRLRNLGFNVSASYGIRIKKESMIALGISAGIISLKLEEDAKIREQGDIAVATAQEGKVVPDAGLGIYYKWKGLYAGFSIPQLFQSNVEFDVDDPEEMNKLIRHYFLAAGYKFPVGEKFELEPSVLLKAVKAAPMQGDITMRGIYDEMVWLGLSYRTGDAVAVFAGVLIKEMLEIGYGYDITTSELNSVSSGSHEVLLGFKVKRSKKGSTGFQVL